MGARGTLHSVSSKAVSKQVQMTDPFKSGFIVSDAELRSAYADILPDLRQAGLVTGIDGPVLEALLMSQIVARKAYEHIRENGVVLEEERIGTGGNPFTQTIKNPSEQILRAHSNMMLIHAKNLGMTWMSRARTESPQNAADDDNPFLSAAQ